jgi:hypothetical protein
VLCHDITPSTYTLSPAALQAKPSWAGNPKALLANAITMLRFDPAWSGILSFNDFSLYAVAKKSPPWQKNSGSNWTDHDDSLTADWLQHAGILVMEHLCGAPSKSHSNRKINGGLNVPRVGGACSHSRQLCSQWLWFPATKSPPSFSILGLSPLL